MVLVARPVPSPGSGISGRLEAIESRLGHGGEELWVRDHLGQPSQALGSDASKNGQGRGDPSQDDGDERLFDLLLTLEGSFGVNHAPETGQDSPVDVDVE